MKNLVLFHTGRGGRFNNAGHVTCEGLIDKFNPEYFGINIYYDDQEENPDVRLENGEVVCKLNELNSEYGTFNIDNEYDTYSWMPLYKLDENYLEIMIRDLKTHEYKNALINTGVDKDVFGLLERNFDLLDYVELLHSHVTFEEFKKFDEVLEFDTEEDAENEGYSDLYKFNDKFYVIE